MKNKTLPKFNKLIQNGNILSLPAGNRLKALLFKNFTVALRNAGYVV